MTIEWVWGLVASFALLAFGFFMEWADAKRQISALNTQVADLTKQRDDLKKNQIPLDTASENVKYEEQRLVDQLNDEIIP